MNCSWRENRIKTENIPPLRRAYWMNNCVCVCLCSTLYTMGSRHVPSNGIYGVAVTCTVLKITNIMLTCESVSVRRCVNVSWCACACVCALTNCMLYDNRETREKRAHISYNLYLCKHRAGTSQCTMHKSKHPNEAEKRKLQLIPVSVCSYRHRWITHYITASTWTNRIATSQTVENILPAALKQTISQLSRFRSCSQSLAFST